MNQSRAMFAMRMLSRCLVPFSAALAVAGCGADNVRAAQPDGHWQRIDQAQTISFADAGRISGDAGCNRFSGTARFDGSDSMRIGPVAATKRACADAARMQAEVAFLAMLEHVRGYRLERGDRLVLLDAAGGSLATFRRDTSTPR